MADDNLRRRTAGSILKAGSGQGVSLALRFASLWVLARLLDPSLFGLLGIALMVVLILKYVSDLGMGAALIQKDELTETEIASVFWANTALSLLLGLLLFLGADLVATLLKEPRLTPMLQVLALVLPINALSTISQALLQRDMQFGRLSLRDISGEIAFGVVGVGLALWRPDIWSLIGALSAQWIFRAASAWIVKPYRPRRLFDFGVLKAMSGFSLAVLGVTLASLVMANIDYLVILRYLGPTPLGYYTLAFQFIVLPSQRITALLQLVMFPSFSKVAGDPARIQRGILTLLRALTLLLLPATVMIAIVAPWLVPFLYTDKWLPAVSTVQILALASFWYVFDIVGSVLFATGQPRWRLAMVVLRATLFLLLAFTYGLERGIEGVAISLLAAVIVSAVGTVLALNYVTGTRLRAVLAALRLPALTTAVAALPGLALWGWVDGLPVNDGLKVTLLGLLMAGIYGIILLIAFRPQVADARTWLREQLTARRDSGAAAG